MTLLAHKPRVKIWSFRLLLAMAVGTCVYAGGCDMPRNESLALGDGPLVASGGHAATTSDAIFEVPEANALAVMYGRENLPEYSRLDGRMNIDSPSIRTATAEWPQYPAADMTSIRYVYLPVNTSSSSQIIPVYRRTDQRSQWRARNY